jgi:glyceraldehyde 3-phosphate dehydrogenase
LKIVAVNDLGVLGNLAYLLKYDSAYGHSNLQIETTDAQIIINGQAINFYQEKEPSKLPWGDLGIDVVVESTGFFESYDKAKLHIDAGARKVVITAPASGEPVPGITSGTVLMGLNEDFLQTCQVSSNASCTTNSASPLMKILDDAIGIEKAILNTVHAYTASQKLVDSPDAKDFRRGRAAAHNIVPSTTGAAKAVALVLPQLKDKFDGIALRVPVITGSVVDITFISKRPTTVEEVNKVLTAGSQDPKWQEIFTVTNEEFVSGDIIGNTHASIADLAFTKVVGGNLVKVLAWYDNETGYAHTLVRHVLQTGQI